VAGNLRYNERALMNETSETFVEFMDALLSNNFMQFAPMELKTLRYTDDNGVLYTNGVDMANYDPVKHRIMVEKSVLLELIKIKIGNPKLTMTQMTYWIKAWAKHRNVVLDSKYRQGREQTLYYRFVKWEYTIPYMGGVEVNTSTTWRAVDDVGDDF
jgi:hypothetical protein